MLLNVHNCYVSGTVCLQGDLFLLEITAMPLPGYLEQ